MTRAELIEKLSISNPILGDADVDTGVRLIFEEMQRVLIAGQRIEMRGFGTFTVLERKPRIGRNPKTGERVDVPPKRVVHFKPGKELRLAVAKPQPRKLAA